MLLTKTDQPRNIGLKWWGWCETGDGRSHRRGRRGHRTVVRAIAEFSGATSCSRATARESPVSRRNVSCRRLRKIPANERSGLRERVGSSAWTIPASSIRTVSERRRAQKRPISRRDEPGRKLKYANASEDVTRRRSHQAGPVQVDGAQLVIITDLPTERGGERWRNCSTRRLRRSNRRSWWNVDASALRDIGIDGMSRRRAGFWAPSQDTMGTARGRSPGRRSVPTTTAPWSRASLDKPIGDPRHG